MAFEGGKHSRTYTAALESLYKLHQHGWRASLGTILRRARYGYWRHPDLAKPTQIQRKRCANPCQSMWNGIMLTVLTKPSLEECTRLSHGRNQKGGHTLPSRAMQMPQESRRG